MDSALAIAPADAYGVVTSLRSRRMQVRAAKSLDHILKERRHGSVGELVKALGVSRTTVGNWRAGDPWPPSPEQVQAICIAYAAAPDNGRDGAIDPNTVERDSDGNLAPELQADVDELFNRFYSDNERDAAAWLIEHKPQNFAWNIVDQAPLVA